MYANSDRSLQYDIVHTYAVSLLLSLVGDIVMSFTKEDVSVIFKYDYKIY